MLTAYRRLAALDRERRRLLFEAFAAIAGVRVGLSVLPFLRLHRVLDRVGALPIIRRHGPADAVAAVNWAMTRASARFPKRSREGGFDGLNA